MRFILFVGLLAFSINSLGQIRVDFAENNLMSNAHPFGAFLCPIVKEKADSLFNVIAKLSIPSRHINGYCESRAEFIARKMSLIYTESGCDVGKIWAFAPSISTLVSNKKLSTSNPLFDGEKVTWGYHVAPIISVKNGDRTDTMVLDLSFNSKKLIEYHKWLGMMHCKELIYTFTDRNYYLFYTLNGLQLTGSKFQGMTISEEFPKIITGHFYYPMPSDFLTVPSGIAYNDLACYLVDKYYNDAQYSDYKDDIKEKTKLNSMKDIIARKDTTLPKEMIEDCVNYYYERLKYWQSLYTKE